MGFELTKKDIIAMNEQFEDGSIVNEASLDFALSYANRTENWIKALAWIFRAILIDHVFEEGNKRTAMLVIKAYAEYRGHGVDNELILKLIKRTLLKNITSIRTIEEGLKDVIN
ncbi:MAG: Fic family protein [Candidatus Woesearchaeota archaeon]